MDIEFRGINEESGRFVYGCLIQSKPNKVDGDCASWIKPRDALMLGAISTPTDTFTKVKTSTVGQFTGLTDKNGKDIYAGDIVDDMFDCGQLKIIYYNEESAGFYSKSIKTWPITGKYDLSISISPETITGGEVIGNIHQHSHLLDKGE